MYDIVILKKELFAYIHIQYSKKKMMQAPTAFRGHPISK